MTVDQIVKNSLVDYLKYWATDFAKYLILAVLLTLIFVTLGEHMSPGFGFAAALLTAAYVLLSALERIQRRKIDKGYDITPEQYYTLRQIYSTSSDNIRHEIYQCLSDGVITQGEYDNIIKTFLLSIDEPGNMQKERLLKQVHKEIEVI